MPVTEGIVMYNTKGLADRLGVSTSTIYRWRCYEPDKVPPAFLVGDRLRWRADDVEEWLERKGNKA